MKTEKRSQLAEKVVAIIQDVVSSIDRTEGAPQINVREDEKRLSVSIDYCGDRCGDNFFTPRPHEEDDDFPDFTGRSKIIQGLKKYLGKQCGLDAYDHEKGLFTVSVTVPKMKAA
jgi:hypothetical protein